MAQESDRDTIEWPPPTVDRRRGGPPSALVQVDFGALSHPGHRRRNNEDHFLVSRFERSLQTVLTNVPEGCVPERVAEVGYAMLVADGLGGAVAGEVASRTAISVLVDLVLHTPDWIMRLDEQRISNVLQRMELRFRQVNEAVNEQAQEDPSLYGMGTTLTLACSLGADLAVVHVGDSRAYLFRQGRLHRLTSDHTMAQSLADGGVIPSEEAATHPLRHVLTNVIGGNSTQVRVELHEDRLMDHDQVLLCTDGLTEMVAEDAIAEALRSAGSAADACSVLVEQALAAGGKDNVTVALCRYRIPQDSA